MSFQKSDHMILQKNAEIFTDGGSRGNPGPGASAFVVLVDGKAVFEHGYFFERTTNNVAEYFAVLMALDWLSKNKNLYIQAEFFIDSELVVKQLNGEYKIKNEKLKNISSKIFSILKGLGIKTSFTYIPREKNREADALVNKTLDEKI